MIFKLNVLDLGILTIIIFSFIFYAQFGLVCNLKFPNLLWTNEAVPVKQGMSVTITLFGSWAFIVTLGGMYFYTTCIGDTLFLFARGGSSVDCGELEHESVVTDKRGSNILLFVEDCFFNNHYL
ncbi:MAG: hypothetical protein ACLTKE_13985 [Coprococcus sp.]